MVERDPIYKPNTPIHLHHYTPTQEVPYEDFYWDILFIFLFFDQNQTHKPFEKGEIIMNRELLEKPFAPEQIKQRIGIYGNVLDYIEGHAVIKRLNDAFDANWSFEIIKNQILEDKDEVVVLGKLAAENVVIKSQFGSSRITRARDTGEIISLADDL